MERAAYKSGAKPASSPPRNLFATDFILFLMLQDHEIGAIRDARGMATGQHPPPSNNLLSIRLPSPRSDKSPEEHSC